MGFYVSPLSWCKQSSSSPVKQAYCDGANKEQHQDPKNFNVS